MDSDARPHVQTLGETKQGFPWPDPEVLKAIRAQLNPEALKAASTGLEALKAASTLQRQLQAVSQPVRRCRHCKQPLWVYRPDGSLEPCTRRNRSTCGFTPHTMGQKLLIGNLACIRSRNAAKGRRKYAARKARKQAGNTASVLQVIDGKARPQ